MPLKAIETDTIPEKYYSFAKENYTYLPRRKKKEFGSQIITSLESNHY